MAETRRKAISLALFSFSDEEFLMVVRDNESEPEGWVTTKELSLAIFGKDSPDENRCVGARLAWMRKFGTIERDEEPGSDTRNSWRLSEMGMLLVNTKLKSAQERAINELSEVETWQASLLLADRYVSSGDTAAALTRRALTNGFYRRRFDK